MAHLGRRFLLLFLTALPGASPLMADETELYVWQQHWRPEVSLAVLAG